MKVDAISAFPPMRCTALQASIAKEIEIRFERGLKHPLIVFTSDHLCWFPVGRRLCCWLRIIENVLETVTPHRKRDFFLNPSESLRDGTVLRYSVCDYQTLLLGTSAPKFQNLLGNSCRLSELIHQ